MASTDGHDPIPQSIETIVLDELSSTSLPYYNSLLWQGDAEQFIDYLSEKGNIKFDLIVTSPPYNIGKSYEGRMSLESYIEWQERLIGKMTKLLSETGSICWQVGNYISNGSILPLDIVLHPIFERLGLKLRNRIIWRFGHGLHCKRRFSGRYEVVMWYTNTEDYVFNLDAVRIPSKYPGKKAYKGPRAGLYSSNPLGKNPEDVWNIEPDITDVWDIPNVKSKHVEKTAHPCQFPIGLIERLVLSLTNEDQLVFDPFAGVGSSGVAATIHGRRFWGCEIVPEYVDIARERLNAAIRGEAQFRPHDKPLYDHTMSKLSLQPIDRQCLKESE